MEKIEIEKVKKLINSNEDVTIINVLSEDSHDQAHIPGSINIPFDDPEEFVQSVEEEVPSKNAKIIVYCANPSCPASENAGKKLTEAGFSSVMCYEGGIEGWKKAGENVERNV